MLAKLSGNACDDGFPRGSITRAHVVQGQRSGRRGLHEAELTVTDASFTVAGHLRAALDGQ